MGEVLEFVLRHGYGVVFVLVLVEQLGLPLPAVPMLLGIGALSRGGHYAASFALGVAVAAALAADLFWYRLGRRRGHAVLRLLCRISLEPDSCVRRSEVLLARHGPRTLLYAKFVPGLNVVATPLAGMLRMRLWRFLLYDGAGVLLWAGTYIGLGRLFADQLLRVLALAQGMATAAGATAFAALLAYLAGKLWQRQRFLREIRVTRITAEELYRRLEAHEELVIVDLRHELDLATDAVIIPGALRIAPEDIEGRAAEIPQGREVVLVCT